MREEEIEYSTEKQVREIGCYGKNVRPTLEEMRREEKKSLGFE